MSILSALYIGEHGAARKPASSGTVASVGLSAAVAIFAVTGSPVTGTGTLNLALNTQAANAIFAGPTTGASSVPTFRSLVAADIPSLDAAKITTGVLATARLGTGTADSTVFLRGDGTWAAPAGAGTVTSVALAAPAQFSVTGSPITGAGTLTLAWASQSANQVFAGPSSGGAAAPTFRSLVADDIPSLDAAKITAGTLATARLGSGTANSTTFLRGDQTWASVTASPGGATTQIQFNDAGSFNGDSNLVWYNTEKALSVLSASTTQYSVSISKSGNGNIGALSASSSSTSSTHATVNISNSGSGFGMILSNASSTIPALRIISNANKTDRGAIELVCYAATAGTHQDAIHMYSSVGGGAGTTNQSIGIKFALESSTTIEQDAGRIAVLWTNATHASRTSAFAFSVVDSAGALSERLRLNGDGTLSLTFSSGNLTNPWAYPYYNFNTADSAIVYARNQYASAPALAFCFMGQRTTNGATYHGIYAARLNASSSVGTSWGMSFYASFSNNYEMARFVANVENNAEGTRSVGFIWQTIYNAGSMTERMRLTSDGTLRVGSSTIYFGLKPAGSGTPVWTMPAADGTSNQVLFTDGSGNLGWMTVGGTGTVTSVALTAPLEFNVSGTPITGAGTLALTWANVSANLVFAGPGTGAATTPGFRAMVSDDIPALNASKITAGTLATARLGSGTADATTFLRGDQTWATPTITTVNDSTFRIQDNGDTTKQIAFEASSIATATTRTITVPNRNVTLDTLTVGTTQVSGGSANRLLMQDTSGFFSYQPNLSYFSTRFGFRHDGNVASSGIMDITVTGSDPTLYVRNYASAYSSATPIIYARVDASSATSSTHDVLVLAADSNSTASAGFGVRMLLRAESSTSSMQEQAALASSWSTATHISRTSRFTLSLVDNASSLAEVFRVDGPGNVTSWITSSATNFLVEGQRISLATSATPAAGFGVSQVFALESSTTSNTDAAYLFTRWVDPTHLTFQVMFGICVNEGTGLSGSYTSPNFAVSGGGTWTQNQKTATSNAVVTAWTRTLDSTSTPAPGFGLRDLIQLDTNATPGVSAAAFDTTWLDASTATATSQWQIYLMDSGALTERYRFLNGGLDLRMTTGRLYINGTQVLTNRITGWTQMTGTQNRGALATYAAPDIDSTYNESQLQALADHVQALSQRMCAHEADDFTHGYIGT